MKFFALICSGLAWLLCTAGLANATLPDSYPPMPPRAETQASSALPASSASNIASTSAPATSASAQPTSAQPIPALPQNIGTAPPASSSMLQVILSLSLVLGLLVLVAWALKRFGPQQMSGGANVKIVGGISLGGRERVLVLEIGEQWIVVGAAPGRVSALASMPKQGELSLEPDMASEKNFSSWLKQIMEKRNGA